jgi:hypothetical protein
VGGWGWGGWVGVGWVSVREEKLRIRLNSAQFKGGCTFFVDCRFVPNIACRLMMKTIKML